jgi:hypothetical protein
LRGAWDRAWSGTSDPLVFAIVRVGLAALVLLRVSDWTAPWLALDHHAWVHGLDHAPWTEVIREPALHAPLLPGLPSVTSPLAGAVAIARPVLAVPLLLGVRPRAAALALAICGYGAMALDRGRYFHHLHLLWLSCAWLALTPCGARLSLEALLRRDGREDRSQKWSLTLLRFQGLVVYAAAGIAKLQPAWIDGTALARVCVVFAFGGGFFELGRDSVGLSGLSIAIAIWELALVPLLAWPRTRVIGVAMGLALHLVLDTSTLVSTFGATMALYLLTFLPWDREGGWLTGRPRLASATP